MKNLEEQREIMVSVRNVNVLISGFLGGDSLGCEARLDRSFDELSAYNGGAMDGVSKLWFLGPWWFW